SLTRDHGRLGFGRPPEQFPKQADVRRCRKGFGNWLRLPGRHHKREHWSRVWDGQGWLEGAQAVAFMLAMEGDPPGLVPESQPPPPPGQTHSRPGPAGGCRSGNLSARIAGYLRRLPNLGEGQGRDDIGYQFACFLVRDLALGDDIARDWLRRWDAGNLPPKGE